MQAVIILFSILLAITLARSPLHVQRTEDVQNKIRRNVSIKAHLPSGNPTPTQYQLKLIPILQEGIDEYPKYSISGEVEIRVVAGTNLTVVTLNAKELDIHTIEFTAALTGESFVATPTLEPENEFLILTLDRNLTPDAEYDIKVKYTAQISKTSQSGMYLSRFIDENGNESELATSQFETTGAREVFPCFDEPEFKATFKTFVGFNPETHIALSNTPVEDEHDLMEFPIVGWKQNEFFETELISTYTIAIIVANYKFVEPPLDTEFPIPVKVYGPGNLVLPVDQGGKNGGAYAALETQKLLKFFEQEYFEDIPSQLTKIDTVIIPQFDAIAMENWGLNTYLNDFVMFYDSETPEIQRVLTTEIIGHELIHQWFGNLVTCSFWDQIWLNEGFADYFQYHGVQHSQPQDFRPLELRQFSSSQVALAFDASPLTHPIINAAQTTGSTFEDFFTMAFTPISYQKGGSLLRMVEEFLTTETFKAGIKRYLGTPHRVVEQDELFEILTDQAIDHGTLPNPYNSIKEIMDTWTLQSGFPLLRVSKASASRIYVSQERFTPDVIYTPGHGLDPDELWTIPVTVQTPATSGTENVITKFWIDKAVGMTSQDVGDTSKLVLLNPTGAGYYRVLYDTQLFNRMLAQLEAKYDNIPIVARSQIIDDYFTFVDHGFTQVENAFSLTKFLHQEKAEVVWATTLKHLSGYYFKLLGGESKSAINEFSTYWKVKLEGVLTDIGFEQPPEEKGTMVILRSQLLDWACALKHTKCIEYATKSFDNWNDEPPVKIPVDIRDTLLCSAIGADATTTRYDIALTRYKSDGTSDPDKARLLNALACTEIPDKITELLNNVRLENENIAEKDRAKLLDAIAGNTLGGRTASIAYFVEHAGDIIAKLGPDAVEKLYATLSNFVLTTEEADELHNVIQDFETELESVKENLEAHLGTVAKNAVWRRENEGRLEDWFLAENIKAAQS